MAMIKTALTALGAAGLALGLGLGAAVAQTQPAAPAAQPPAQEGNPWVKVCSTDPQSKREICLTTQELRAEGSQTLVSVALREISGEARKVMLFAVPPGMLIQPGLRVAIDKGKQEEGKYTICFPNLCYGDMVVSDQFIANMKKGQQLFIVALNQQAKPVQYPLTLNGFKTAHEGKPIDANELARQQNELQSELAKRAEAERQRLIQEQQKAQGDQKPQ